MLSVVRRAVDFSTRNPFPPATQDSGDPHDSAASMACPAPATGCAVPQVPSVWSTRKDADLPLDGKYSPPTLHSLAEGQDTPTLRAPTPSAARPGICLDAPQDPPDSDATYAEGKPTPVGEGEYIPPASAQSPAEAHASALVEPYWPVSPVTAFASPQVPADSSATNSPPLPKSPAAVQPPGAGQDTALTTLPA